LSIKRFSQKKHRTLAMLLMIALVLTQFLPVPSYAADYVRIKNYWTNQYLYESNGQVAYGNPAAGNQSSHWEIVDYSGYKRIRNRASGNYINIETTSGYLDSVKCNSIGDGAWSSHWTISNGTVSGTKTMKNRWRDTWYMHVEDSTGYAQCSQIPPDWGTVQWYFENVQSTGTVDLIVTDISWSPANPQQGNEVVFSAVVKNQGTAASPSGVKHGLGFFVDGVQVSWNDAHYSSIPAGQSVTLTANGGPNGKSSWTATGGNHTIKAVIDDTYIIDESNENNNSREESMSVSQAPVNGNGNGLKGEYFDNMDLTNLKLTRTDPNINFNWGNGSPDASIGADTFSVRWTGQVQPRYSGTYTFYMLSDNGRRVWVNNQLIIDKWIDDWDIEYSGTINLTAGQKYDIKVEYFENNGGANAKLSWSSAQQSKEVIPQSQLYSDPVSSGALPNGLYRIRNNWQSNQYLYESNGQVKYGTPSSSDESSQWALVDLNGNKALWNRATGNYITIAGITSADSPLATSYTDTSSNAQFAIEAGSQSGYYVIRSIPQNNWYVNIEGLKGYAQCYSNVQPGWGSPQWAFEYVGSVPSRPAPSATPTPTPPPDPGDRGASLPFKTYEAEEAATNGTILGPSRTYREIASEASNRRAVQLSSTGRYVEFTLTEPADSMVIRYCIPDAAGGGGINTTISMYVNGSHNMDIPLTSKYSWVYGAYPWTNNPSDGLAHRFFDETRVTFNTLQAGTKIRLQKDSGDTASYYVIDLVDFEKRPTQLTQPANSLSITSYGAVPNDGIDDKAALINCIAAAKAQGKSVWLPAGTFDLTTPGYITVDNVTIRGAGMWYTTLKGIGAAFALNGNNCKFYDFSIFGDTTRREDSSPETAFDGNAGTGSVIQNIWAEHLKCGVWVNSPTNGIQILNSRFRNTFADGVNLCGGTKNSLVQNCHFRNTGDDSIAVWSATWISSNPCEGNTVRNNTVQSPWLANCIAVYGGKNNTIENNLVVDSVAFGAGINVSSNFDPADFSGTTTVRNNTLLRTGSYEWNMNYARGAIWVYACQKNINASVQFSNNDVYDSTYQGIFIEGPYNISNLSFDNIRIVGTGTYGINIRNTAVGSASFSNVSVSGTISSPLYNESTNFTVIRGSGNSGW
jgi:hypothetical protein